MSRQHVVTFYSIENIKDHKKIGRSVERFCLRNNLVGTFFSTPQGINTTLSGKKFFLLIFHIYINKYTYCPILLTCTQYQGVEKP